MKTGPNPPSPILLEEAKSSVAALICLKVKVPILISSLCEKSAEQENVHVTQLAETLTANAFQNFLS